MDVRDFQETYAAELQEACSIEVQLVEALPKIAEAASAPELQQAIRMHLEETREHQRLLEDLLLQHGVSSRQHTDQSMQAMIKEAEKWKNTIQDPPLRDAALIASIQRIEHYEIAVYGTLATWAKQLGMDKDRYVFRGILDQEKQAIDKLTTIAKADVNPAAAVVAT
jgi:ferritin-like metal-binding protein YciE